jgi:hypothetical protein
LNLLYLVKKDAINSRLAGAAIYFLFLVRNDNSGTERNVSGWFIGSGG